MSVISSVAAALPPPVYAVGLLAAAAGVALLLAALGPPVSRETVLAFVPWMFTGAALRALDATVGFPGIVAPFFGPVAVYLTTFVAAGTVWGLATFLALVRDRPATSSLYLGAVGSGAAVTFVGFTLWVGGVTRLEVAVLPVAGLVVAEFLAGLVYLGLGFWRTDVVAKTGLAGGLVVFAHVLEGISLPIAVDVLGAAPRTTLDALFVRAGSSLPTASVVGVGWPAVAVRLAAATLLVVLLADYVGDHPRRGNLLLTAVVAVGVGPGAFDLLRILLVGMA